MSYSEHSPFKLAPQIFSRAYRAADQLNLVNGVWTKVLCTSESFDPGSFYDAANSRFIAPQSGYYQVNACVRFKDVVADKEYGAAIYANGTNVAKSLVHASLVGSVLSAVVSDLVYVAAGQDIELYALSRSGDDAVDVYGEEASTWFSIFYVSY